MYSHLLDLVFLQRKMLKNMKTVVQYVTKLDEYYELAHFKHQLCCLNPHRHYCEGKKKSIFYLIKDKTMTR